MQEAKNVRRIVLVYVGFLLTILALSFLMLFLYYHQSPLQKCMLIQIPGKEYSCIISIANATGNVSMCSKLFGSYKYSCYATIAEKAKNIALCTEISNSTIQSACESEIAFATGNASICGIESNYGACYTEFANKTLNVSLCSHAGNYEDLCLAIVYTKLAMLSGKASYCNMVPEIDNLTQISEVIANTTTQRLENETAVFEGYLLMPNQTYTARDFCLFAEAYLSHNASICYLMPYSQLQTACVNQETYIPVNQPNSTLNYTAQMANCNLVLPQYASVCRQAVTVAFAIKNKNATYCDNLQGSERNACFSYVAMAEKNESLCNEITNSTMANACIESIKLNVSG